MAGCQYFGLVYSGGGVARNSQRLSSGSYNFVDKIYFGDC